ncbi:hypothetical protein BC833DRAFT_593502 [Globomyces pollinis-pini]|nr:hypothetical protein BC833DRAFT_593502 [Globomyces pollinis-pini]
MCCCNCKKLFFGSFITWFVYKKKITDSLPTKRFLLFLLVLFLTFYFAPLSFLHNSHPPLLFTNASISIPATCTQIRQSFSNFPLPPLTSQKLDYECDHLLSSNPSMEIDIKKQLKDSFQKNSSLELLNLNPIHLSTSIWLLNQQHIINPLGYSHITSFTSDTDLYDTFQWYREHDEGLKDRWSLFQLNETIRFNYKHHFDIIFTWLLNDNVWETIELVKYYLKPNAILYIDFPTPHPIFYKNEHSSYAYRWIPNSHDSSMANAIKVIIS